MKSEIKTIVADYNAGRRDRMVGYYDKWYRYNHCADGRAYDAGVKDAIADPKCVAHCNIIECNN